jgi:hypothetical protein
MEKQLKLPFVELIQLKWTPEYYCQSQLIERGWNIKLIEKFYPIPDELKTNPYYYHGSLMKLYNIYKVHQIEETLEFKTEMIIINKNKERRNGYKNKKKEEIMIND